MRLGTKQELFMRKLPRLIDKVHEMGYEIRGGDLFRDPRLHGQLGKRNVVGMLIEAMIIGKDWLRERKYESYGHTNSCHKLKLAIDLNLSKDGVYLEGDDAKAAHNRIHDWWDTQDGAARILNDLNHYSLEHEGFR
jgi:hypothetical protein